MGVLKFTILQNCELEPTPHITIVQPNRRELVDIVWYDIGILFQHRVWVGLVFVRDVTSKEYPNCLTTTNPLLLCMVTSKSLYAESNQNHPASMIMGNHRQELNL